MTASGPGVPVRPGDGRDGDRRRQLVELGYRLAQILDDRGMLEAGIVRQLSAAVAEGGDRPDEGCLGCGRRLDQPATGRRRKWCAEACRSRARRR